MYDLDEAITEFESRITQALRYKYRVEPNNIAESLIEISPVTKIDIRKFLSFYQAQNVYPMDRLEKLVNLLMDVKLQLFFILEIDLGLYNFLLFDQGYNQQNAHDNPYMVLKKFSLDQNLILKSRILFERVMNLIYFLETGKELEVGGKSKKNRFFKFVVESPKLGFWNKYREYVEWFDNSLRTPEVHKGSILKKHFIAKTMEPDERVISLANIIINVFWPSLIAALRGQNFTGRVWFPGMNPTEQ